MFLTLIHFILFFFCFAKHFLPPFRIFYFIFHFNLNGIFSLFIFFCYCSILLFRFFRFIIFSLFEFFFLPLFPLFIFSLFPFRVTSSSFFLPHIVRRLILISLLHSCFSSFLHCSVFFYSPFSSTFFLSTSLVFYFFFICTFLHSFSSFLFLSSFFIFSFYTSFLPFFSLLFLLSFFFLFAVPAFLRFFLILFCGSYFSFKPPFLSPPLHSFLISINFKLFHSLPIISFTLSLFRSSFIIFMHLHTRLSLLFLTHSYHFSSHFFIAFSIFPTHHFSCLQS